MIGEFGDDETVKESLYAQVKNISKNMDNTKAEISKIDDELKVLEVKPDISRTQINKQKERAVFNAVRSFKFISR